MKTLKSKKGCRLIERNLIGIAENDLENATFREIKGHLEHCQPCARLCRNFSQTWQNMSVRMEMSRSSVSLRSLMGKVAAYDEHPSRWPEVFISARRFFRPAVAFLLLLAGVLAGHELGRISRDRARLDYSFAVRLLGSFEDVPPGSVADFYVSRQSPQREKNEK